MPTHCNEEGLCGPSLDENRGAQWAWPVWPAEVNEDSCEVCPSCLVPTCNHQKNCPVNHEKCGASSRLINNSWWWVASKIDSKMGHNSVCYPHWQEEGFSENKHRTQNNSWLECEDLNKCPWRMHWLAKHTHLVTVRENHHPLKTRMVLIEKDPKLIL